VDQVVQIEAVLPNGELVRFGPTEWEAADGFLVPRTTAVSGVCCSNPEESNEDVWIWTECSKAINFDDLWFAFRGGGGGTWGVVTSVYLQLHEYLPYEAVQLPTSGNFSEALSATMPPLIARFVLDFMIDPESIGVSKEVSDACGSPVPASGYGWICYGEGTAAAFETAFNQFVSSNSETLLALGLSQEDIEIAQTILTTITVIDFAAVGLSQSIGTPYEGKLKDDGGNPSNANTEGQMNILVPKSWILENKERFIEILLPAPHNSINSLYYAFAGNTGVSHDQTSSLSSAHREAAFMFVFQDSVQQVKYNEILQEMYDFTGTEFPAYLGANHLGPSAYGPLKSDWTTPCPLTFTRKESEELCVPAQQAVWGSETLQRLEAIKQEIDPDGMFNCFRCAGHTVTFDDEQIDSTPEVSDSTEDPVEDQPESPPLESGMDSDTDSGMGDIEEESSSSSGKNILYATAVFALCALVPYM